MAIGVLGFLAGKPAGRLGLIDGRYQSPFPQLWHRGHDPTDDYPDRLWSCNPKKRTRIFIKDPGSQSYVPAIL